MKVGQKQVLSGKRWIWGRQVYVSAMGLEDGELLIIIPKDSPQTAISDYAHRLSKLLALLSLAMCWAILMGEWLEEQKPLTIKKIVEKRVRHAGVSPACAIT